MRAMLLGLAVLTATPSLAQVQVTPECVDLARRHGYPPVLSKYQAISALVTLRRVNRRKPTDETSLCLQEAEAFAATYGKPSKKD